jgi:anaerobic carbon-monoxide dehydrogenase iron sulfur subunit
MKKVLMVDINACNGCRICEVICSLEKEKVAAPTKSRIRILRVDEAGLDVPGACQHCESPPCADVCPMDAITRDPNTEGVVINQDRCIGCRACTFVCPYGVISLDVDKKVMIKCDLCDGEPQCAKYCPKGALIYERADVIDTLRRERSLKLFIRPLLKSRGDLC